MTPTPSTLPNNTAAPGLCTCNHFTASDGKWVYYSSGDGIHRMDVSGGNDTDLDIEDCHWFVCLDSEDLYYLEDDNEDFTAYDESNRDSAYNLVMYDTATGESTRIQEHLYESTGVVDGKIYMISQVGPNCLLCYDTARKTLTNVTGITDESVNYRLIYFMTVGKQICICLNLDCGDSYLIQGDTVDMSKKAKIDYHMEIGSYGEWDDGSLSVWTGKVYKKVNISSKEEVVDVDKADSMLYVFTDIPADFGSDTNLGSETVALYAVTFDAKVKRILHKTYAVMEGCSNYCEFINGWYFCFWAESDDDGPISGIMFKEYVG